MKALQEIDVWRCHPALLDLFVIDHRDASDFPRLYIRTDSRDLPKAAGNAWSHSWSEAGSSRVTVDP